MPIFALAKPDGETPREFAVPATTALRPLRKGPGGNASPGTSQILLVPSADTVRARSPSEKRAMERTGCLVEGVQTAQNLRKCKETGPDDLTSTWPASLVFPQRVAYLLASPLQVVLVLPPQLP